MINIPLLAVAGFCTYRLLDSKNYKGRLRRMAVAYVERKYGFRAKAGDVGTMSIGWLEPAWNKGKSAYVQMSYGGTTFHVRASLLGRVDECTDTYQMEEFAKRILAPIREGLGCENLCAVVHYGGRDYGGSYLGMGVRSFEDLVENVGGIELTASTYGVDRSRIERLDLSYLGENHCVGIYEWDNAGVVESGYTPFGPVQPSDGDTVCLREHFLHAGGSWTHRSYRHFDGRGVTFAYRADLGIEIAPTDVGTTCAEDEVARSPWYRLSTACDEQTRVIVFPHETSPDVKMQIQFYDLSTCEISDGFGPLPYYGEDEGHDLFPSKWPYHGAVWINLTHRDGTVDRGPQVVRIVGEVA